MPTLKHADVESLLSNFPTTRLSYEVPVHKNDNSGSIRDSKCFIIPKGRRCVAWATEWNRKKIFAIIEVQTQRNQVPALFRKFHEVNGWYPGPVQVFDTCFHSELTYGTVFGGVLFRPERTSAVHCGHQPHAVATATVHCGHPPHAVATTTVHCGHPPHAVATTTTQCFSIIHVYWYKGTQIPSLTLSSHVDMCERMFTTDQALRQVAYTQSNSIIFGLPVLCTAVAAVASDDAFLHSLPYPVYSILYRSNTSTRVYSQNLFASIAAPATISPAPAPVRVAAPVASVVPVAKEYIKPDDDMLTNIQAVFIVRPNVQNDIYELFVKTGGPGRGGASREVFHNFAHVPNYKTSVMMNRLFRNIRENERLDAMEESETEEEFENIELDKYVSLHKEYKFVCKLNKKFCRWVPISVVPQTSEVVNDFQVKQHESRYNITMYRRTAVTAAATAATAPVKRPFSRGGGGGGR
jgi:hypothetical protein